MPLDVPNYLAAQAAYISHVFVRPDLDKLYGIAYSTLMQSLPPRKVVRFLGGSLAAIRQFPKDARNEAGDQLLLVQIGEMPEDWKPMPEIGSGSYEIRIHKPDEYRVIYVAKFPEAIYVLHAYGKKTQKARQKELEHARRVYAQMLQQRKQ